MSDIDVITHQTVEGTRYFVRHDYDLESLDDAPAEGPYEHRFEAENAAESISALVSGSAE